MDNLSQYSQPSYPITRGTLSGSLIVNDTVNNPDFSQLTKSLVNSGTVPNPNKNNTYVVFHVSPSVAVSGACVTYCAYHSYIKTKFGDIAFGVIPDQGGDCTWGCGPGYNDDPFLAVCDSASHELSESVTDPHPDTGYIDSTADANEVGDL
ncbi:UNVERIFIED_CONTAM: hypothetical protein HDU68_010077 [Siphonaria sp. JEL0065]|nr:hypothetical protein HDU68_010077 [Siphonaria sp. JEL0065]